MGFLVYELNCQRKRSALESESEKNSKECFFFFKSKLNRCYNNFLRQK
jgi:hypothetical protein